MSIAVKIYRQNRRSMMMRAIPGVVEVFIPHQLEESDSRVQKFIREGLKKLETSGELPSEPPTVTPRAQIEQMVVDYCAIMNIKPQKVQFRDMRRKWGSCSARGTITLNTRLSWLETPLVEYIVCHELAHLIELNHSARFWAVVERFMPDYKKRVQALRTREKNLW